MERAAHGVYRFPEARRAQPREAVASAVAPHLVTQAIDTAKGRGRLTAGEADGLRRALAPGWRSFSFARSQPETIDVPSRAVKLRRVDVVDLHLLRSAYYSDGVPAELRPACMAVFDARFAEAEAAGVEPRHWPPTLARRPHWAAPYARLAAEVGIAVPFAAAIAALNDWIAEIDAT